MRIRGAERERAEQITWEIRHNIGRQLDMALIANHLAELVQIIENIEREVERLSEENSRLLTVIELGSLEPFQVTKLY